MDSYPGLAHTTFLVLDVETTGLDPAGDRVCEIAGVWVRGGEILTAGSFLVNPGRPIPPEASAVHHLTDRHVREAEPLEAVLPKFLGLHEFDAFAAHNAAFDFGFVPALGRPVLCTMRLAMKLWKQPKYSNQYLRYALPLEVPEAEGLATHSALPDALVTARLLVRELEEVQQRREAPQDVEALAAWADAPNLLETCTFGKHKGKPWATIPKDYLAWMLGNMGDLSPDLRHTLRHYLGKD